MSQTEGLVVRTITEYDPAVAEAIGRLLPEVASTDTGNPVSKSLLEDIINSPDRDQLIAELPDIGVVGAATVNRLVHIRKDKAYLDYIVSRRDVRGQGVGYALWLAVRQWCLENTSSGQLNWTASNPDSQDFYLRQGATMEDTGFFEIVFQQPQ